jgi:Cu2+-exporting ATPase
LRDLESNHRCEVWVSISDDTTLAFIVRLENDAERGAMTKKLEISGMTCDHCVSHVKSALEGVEGVSEADVSLENHEAEVTLSSDVIDADLIAAVEGAGYEAEVR